MRELSSRIEENEIDSKVLELHLMFGLGEQEKRNIFIDKRGKFLLYKRKFQSNKSEFALIFSSWQCLPAPASRQAGRDGRGRRETYVPYCKPKRNKGRKIDGYLFCEDNGGPQGEED